VQCDERIPGNVPGAIKKLTQIGSKFWTTAWKDVPGPKVRETKIVLTDVKDDLLEKATIADKVPKTPENEQALKDAIDEELDNLSAKAEDGHGPTQTFMALMKRMDQLEEDMKAAPPDRMGQYMQCRDLQQNYVDRLGLAMKAQSILEQAKVNIHQKLSAYASKTEILWLELATKNNKTSCPELDGLTLAESFSYDGLVPDDVAGKGTLYSPPPPMGEVMTACVQQLVPQQTDNKDEIDNVQEEIDELKDKEAETTSEPEKRAIKKKLRRLNAQKKNLKAFNVNLQKQIDSVHTSVDNSFAQAQKCQQMAKSMADALAKNKEAFAEFANGTTALKAVWTSKNPENPGAGFETRICTETLATQDSKSTVTSHTNSVTAGGSAGGSFWGFTAKASASGTHSKEEAHAEGEDKAKQEVFHFECEGCYGSLQNDLMDTVLQAFKSDQWFIEGQTPGIWWKPPPGKNIRFYVAEIFFARKLMFKTSSSEATNAIQANTTTTSNSASWSVEVGAYGASVGTSGTVAAADTETDQESSMQRESKDDALYHGDLYIKFLLLKPVIPAPKRESAEPKELEWNTPDYAKTHLGV